MQMKRTIRLTLLSALAILLTIPALGGSVLATETPVSIELASKIIQISTFYNGTTLEVTGSVPVDSDAVIQVSGPKHDVHLKEKGKVAGFLWMNKTDVSLENTPVVYMVYTPAGPKENFISPALGIGYKALVNDITINPESADKAFIFSEYVKLMEESGVYTINEGSVTYGEVSQGMKKFTTTLTIPSKMSPGEYTIEVVAVKNGMTQNRAQKTLTMKMTGFPATISTLAYGSPLLFGFMAVFIAIAAGLIIGMIFRGGGGGAH